MKMVSKLTLTIFAVGLAAFLTACGSKSGGSSGKSAATPGSSCKWNAQYNTYLDNQGRYCNAYNGQSCINQGLRYDAYTMRWYDLSGNVVSCNDGGQWGNNGYFPYNGYYGGYSINGCEGWNQIYYPDQYIPVDVGGGQMVCANMKWIGGYYPQVYNYPYSYYQYNPIYAYQNDYMYYGGGYGNGYNNCSSSLGVSFSNWTGGNQFGIGGYFCF